ncbi:hypothetical protein CAPTEDRAFT_211540 [Capitella teleta]|uniref:Sushi domain-containing protein n=1 Tax=Capitella teleta TaxID=283909 RepID=R7TB18_CAPTE|nr:hypothetical protein CAPTEDRAFT_211540 [Capitella teleta]|eukprot:ELT90702.1 hypothetical protein CAPTEDRAFT_211540 [Capitella teleta]
MISMLWTYFCGFGVASVALLLPVSSLQITHNVTSYMESECSSQRSCTISMNDVTHNNVLPECARGLITFMDVTHACVKGQPLQDLCSPVTATASEKFFFSKQAMNEQCPSPGFVTLEAPPGQNIQVKIIILADDNNPQEIGGFVENGIEHAYTMSTNSDGRLEGQYTSEANRITLVIGSTNPTYIIAFQATGCITIKPPDNSVIEQNGDSLVVKCRFTEQVWNLKCIGTRWIGAVGACKVITVPPIIVIPEDNEYDNIDERNRDSEIISNGKSLIRVFFCLILCVCIRDDDWMKRKYLPNKDYEKCEMVAVDGTIAHMLKTNNVHTWQNTMSPTMTRNDHVPAVAMDRDFITVNTNNL